MIIDIGTIKRKTNFVYTDGIGAMCDLKEQFVFSTCGKGHLLTINKVNMRGETTEF